MEKRFWEELFQFARTAGAWGAEHEMKFINKENSERKILAVLNI